MNISDIINQDNLVVESGIKSKQRVSERGEVFTPEWVVNDMLDLIPTVDKENKCIKINETYLEPACGNGNFLVKIIERKLNSALREDKSEFLLNVIKCYTTTYGVDIMQDNVEESRIRMLQELVRNNDVADRLNEMLGDNVENYVRQIEFILGANIKHGNMLTGKVAYGEHEGDNNIVFIDWQFDGNKVTAVQNIKNGNGPLVELGGPLNPDDKYWFKGVDAFSMRDAAYHTGVGLNPDYPTYTDSDDSDFDML